MGELDGILRLMTDGLPRAPKRYELRCAMDVLHALRELSFAEPGEYVHREPPAPLYGSADVIVDDEFRPGFWELSEDGRIVKQGFRGADGNFYVTVPPPLA